MRATYDEYFLKGNWLDRPLLPHKPLTKGPFFSAGPFLPDRFFPDRFYPDRFYLDRSYPDRSYRHPNTVVSKHNVEFDLLIVQLLL